MNADRSEWALRLVLRLSGLALILALPAALMPTTAMRWTNDLLLSEPLPATRLVEYLTRSISGLYACLGFVTWFLATDVRRYLPIIVCKAVAGTMFGVGITLLDWAIGMPWYWTAVEGPGIVLISVVTIWLARRAAAGFPSLPDAPANVGQSTR
jgi:hypothetical protein